MILLQLLLRYLPPVLFLYPSSWRGGGGTLTFGKEAVPGSDGPGPGVAHADPLARHVRSVRPLTGVLNQQASITNNLQIVELFSWFTVVPVLYIIIRIVFPLFSLNLIKALSYQIYLYSNKIPYNLVPQSLVLPRPLDPSLSRIP